MLIGPLQPANVRARSLQGNVAVFFPGVDVLFVFEGAEGADDAGAGFGGLDDGVDVAALSRNDGIGETIAEFGDFFLAQRFAPGFGRLSPVRACRRC